MLKEERHLYIQNKIRSEGKVVLTEICQEMNVSDDTIRRDLQELEKEGILTKVHGGAIAPTPTMTEAETQPTKAPDRHALWEKATEQLSDGDTILMGGDELTIALAHSLPHSIRLTIFTNSLPVAIALADKPLIQVVVLGGNLLPARQITVGATLIQSLQSLKADWLIAGNVHLDAQKGLTVSNREDTTVMKEMYKRCRRLLVVAEADQLDSHQPYGVGPLSDASVLILPDSVPPALREKFAAIKQDPGGQTG